MKTDTWPDFLYLNFKKFTFPEILSGEFEVSPIRESEKQCLNFCKNWLSGSQTFMGQTSGSTGTPKPIVLQRTAMQSSANATAKALDLHPGDKSLVCIPTHYIGGQMMLVRGLVLGLELHIIDAVSNPFKILKAQNIPQSLHFDLTAFVPLQLQTILGESPQAIEELLNPMKAILLGGAPIPETLQRRIQAIRAPVFHTYGMTETVSHIALKKINGSDASTCFQTLDQVEIAQDEQECLRIRAPQTGGIWIQTRDRVRILNENCFEWLGRVDFVINTGGIKVQGELIEKSVGIVLMELQIEREFFVFGRAHERLGQELCLLLEGEHLHETQEKNLMELLKDRLKKHEIPRKIYYLPQFIRTETSKIQREATIQAILASLT